MCKLDQEGADSMLSLITDYFTIVEIRMQRTKDVAMFLRNMDNVKARELVAKYDELMNGFWDKADVTRPIKAMYNGKSVPIQRVLRSWDTYGDRWKAAADYADTLDDFTLQVISVATEQVKRLLYNLSALEKDAASAALGNTKSMEALLLADPL